MCVCECVSVCVHHTYIGVVMSELREPLVVRSEVVPPLTDTMCLVDYESRQFASTVQVSQS